MLSIASATMSPGQVKSRVKKRKISRAKQAAIINIDQSPRLTIKQENFCIKYIELDNASEAYRQVYNTENSTPKSVWEQSCWLMKNPKVSTRIKMLREAAQITVDDIISEYEEVRQLSKEAGQYSSMVAATSGKAKVLGLDKLTIAGDKDNPLRIVQGLSDQELLERMEQIKLQLMSIDA
jgi:uncharacterized coiled-coil DUF342 family protein